MNPLLILPLLMGLFLLGCSYEPSGQKELDEGYKYEFSTLPPKGVTVTHARLTGIRDSEANWLRFEMQEDPHVFVVSRGFTKLEKLPTPFSDPKRTKPSWWNPEPVAAYAYYECDSWPQLHGLHWAKAYVAVGVSEKTIYFLCDRGG